MSYTCPRCGTVSLSPEDERHGYCAICHDVTGVPPEQDQAWREMVAFGQELQGADDLSYRRAVILSMQAPGEPREGKLHVLTENGSEYVLDRAARTWTRVTSSERSGDLRTGGSGDYWGFTVTDRGLVIIGPPVDPGQDFREVRTSPVSETWEETVAGEPVEKINKKLKDKHGFRGAEGQEGAREDPPPDQGGGTGGR